MLFSEPKIPQTLRSNTASNSALVSVLFSEPKIPQTPDVRPALSITEKFQCSSASRKFLKGKTYKKTTRQVASFSALQRAENSSNDDAAPQGRGRRRVSVLFSEPKIPQTNSANGWRRAWRVSVLFSEPKIPQINRRRLLRERPDRFSALQRAENSSK